MFTFFASHWWTLWARLFYFIVVREGEWIFYVVNLTFSFRYSLPTALSVMAWLNICWHSSAELCERNTTKVLRKEQGAKSSKTNDVHTIHIHLLCQLAELPARNAFTRVVNQGQVFADLPQWTPVTWHCLHSGWFFFFFFNVKIFCVWYSSMTFACLDLPRRQR